MTSTSTLTASTVATPATETVNWEVIWSEDEQDRIRYIDHGDGSWLSQDAETRAIRKFLGMVVDGVRCSLYRNGVCVSAVAVLAD
jgi:hypothetical protein